MRFHKLNRGMIVVLVAAGCVVCASVVTKVGHTADPPAAAKTVEALSDYEEDEPIRRKANLKTFREAFEQGRSLSVRARLDRAATVTGELAALAEKVSDKNIAKLLVRNGHTSRAAIYPRFSHLVRLLVVRPWVRDQLLGAREPTEL